MTDHATPNLPSRDFALTSAFYEKIGFSQTWVSQDWMILKRGDLVLEFFHHPKVDPLTSWFSCCLRVDTLDPFYNQCLESGIPESNTGYPRLHAPKLEDWGGRVGALIDIDGTLVRLIENPAG